MTVVTLVLRNLLESVGSTSETCKVRSRDVKSDVRHEKRIDVRGSVTRRGDDIY